MFVSQPVVLRDYKRAIDSIYENIIEQESALFTIEASDRMEEVLKKVLYKNGLSDILEDMDGALNDEIRLHFSYERKKWEWTIVYQMLLKLSVEQHPSGY